MTVSLKNSKIARNIYSVLPLSLRNGHKTYDNYRQLIKQYEFKGKSELIDYQLVQLKKIVDYSWENIIGYKKYWIKNGFSPDKLKSLKDIERIPFINKNIIRENLDLFSNKNIKSTHLETTGGSTGTPFGFYSEKKNQFIEQAFIHEIWKRQLPSISQTTLKATLRGNLIESEFDFNYLDGLTLSIYDINQINALKFVDVIQKYKPEFLQAYPSALSIFSSILKESSINLEHKFKSIMLGSEPLYNHQKSLFKEIFDTKLSFWYGHTEKVVLAGNCEKSDYLHCEPIYGFVEMVDINGTQIKSGDFGEIVGTGFWNFATPIIRYKTGDFGIKGDDHCDKCGRNYELIKSVEGRSQDVVYNIDKEKITLTGLIFAQHFNAFSNLLNMQLIQERYGELVVNVVPGKNFSVIDIEEIKTKIQIASKGKIKVDIKLNEELIKSPIGKQLFLVQKIKDH